MNLARRMKEYFGGRPLVLMGFSRGAWWGFEWFSAVEPTLFDRFYAVAGYPLNRYGADAAALQSKAEALKRHLRPSVWIASTADGFCQVTGGYAAFYRHLQLEDVEPSSCRVLISQVLGHGRLRDTYLVNTPEDGLLNFLRTGDTSRVEPSSPPPPPPPPTPP